MAAGSQLIGPGRSVEQYALEGQAGVAEVCLTLLETGALPNAGEVRATAATAVRRLHRYARTFPRARPRALICRGRLAWADGHEGTARRAWSRAVREAERRGMPFELAGAHLELGRHSPGGGAHLALAEAGFRALDCRSADEGTVGQEP